MRYSEIAALPMFSHGFRGGLHGSSELSMFSAVNHMKKNAPVRLIEISIKD
jgi:hypothetical protein